MRSLQALPNLSSPVCLPVARGRVRLHGSLHAALRPVVRRGRAAPAAPPAGSRPCELGLPSPTSVSLHFTGGRGEEREREKENPATTQQQHKTVWLPQRGTCMSRACHPLPLKPPQKPHDWLLAVVLSTKRINSGKEAIHSVLLLRASFPRMQSPLSHRNGKKKRKRKREKEKKKKTSGWAPKSCNTF